MRLIRNMPILLLILFTAVSVVLWTETPSPADDGVVILSVPPSGWEPFSIPSPRRPGRDGVLVETFRAIAASAGRTVRIETHPEREGFLLLRHGKVDAAPKAKEWVAGPKRYLWTDPVFLSTDVVVSRADAPVAYAEPDDLRGRSVGLIAGFKYPRLTPLIDGEVFKIRRAASVRELLLLLLHGEIECAVVNPVVARWVIRNRRDMAPRTFVFSDLTVDGAPFRFAFTGGDRWKPFVAKFNAELKRMQKDGRLAVILNHYQ